MSLGLAGDAPAGQRIAVVTTSYPADADDASGHFVHAEVEALRGQGHDVSVVAPLPANRAATDMPGVYFVRGGEAFGFPGALARLRARPVRAAAGALEFVLGARRVLARLAPQRVVAHFLVPSAWPIATELGPRGSALEAVGHGSDVRLVARLPLALRRRIASALAHADIRCVSEDLRAELGDALGPALLRRIRVEASPLVLPQRLDRAAARARLGRTKTERLVVVVARLVREKRVAAALRAARAIPDATSVVVGDGPERSALERAFPEALFVGQLPRSEALAWIAAADVLLSASREEGAPSAVREARALGTPVVALAAGDLEAWSRNDPELWVVRPARPRSGRQCAP